MGSFDTRIIMICTYRTISAESSTLCLWWNMLIYICNEKSLFCIPKLWECFGEMICGAFCPVSKESTVCYNLIVSPPDFIEHYSVLFLL